MKSNWVALLLLLCTIAFGISADKADIRRFSSPSLQTQKFRINSLYLVTSRSPLEQDEGWTSLAGVDAVSLQAENHKMLGANVHIAHHVRGVLDSDQSPQLKSSDWDLLTEKLSKLEGWRTEHCNDGTPEDRVMYTRLEMDTNQGRFASNWRGFPPEQKLVLQALIASPFGPTLRNRIARLSAAKAESE